MAGHPGAEETARALQRHFFWPLVYEDVRRYVRGCLLCAATKRGPHLPNNAPLWPRQPQHAWETVGFDIMGPCPASSPAGNWFVLVATDLYSRWVEAVGSPNFAATVIVDFLEEVFTHYGYLENVLIDNGTQFDSVAWNHAIKKWGVAHWTTGIFHPRAKPTERRNQ